MAKVTLRYSTDAFRLINPPELRRTQEILKAFGPPPLSEVARQKLALPPGLVEQLKLEAEQFKFEFELPAECNPTPEVQTQREAAKPAAGPPPPLAIAPAAPIETTVAFAKLRKENPKCKGERNTDYAKRLRDLLKKIPVTKVWTIDSCRRELYRRKPEKDFAPDPGTLLTLPKRR
jgi:hypothetical protein